MDAWAGCCGGRGDRASPQGRKPEKAGDAWGGVSVLLTGACRLKGQKSRTPRGPHLLQEGLCPSRPHQAPSAAPALLQRGHSPPTPREGGLLAHTGLRMATSLSPALSGLRSAQRPGGVQGRVRSRGEEFPWKREVQDVSVWDPGTRSRRLGKGKRPSRLPSAPAAPRPCTCVRGLHVVTEPFSCDPSFKNNHKWNVYPAPGTVLTVHR